MNHNACLFNCKRKRKHWFYCQCYFWKSFLFSAWSFLKGLLTNACIYTIRLIRKPVVFIIVQKNLDGKALHCTFFFFLLYWKAVAFVCMTKTCVNWIFVCTCVSVWFFFQSCCRLENQCLQIVRSDVMHHDGFAFFVSASAAVVKPLWGRSTFRLNISWTI